MNRPEPHGARAVLRELFEYRRPSVVEEPAVIVTVGLWSAAAAGIAAVLVAILDPARRRAALVVATCLFLPIGIAGILSIGALFLLAVAACLVAAARATPHGELDARSSEGRH